jgi:hypothetical protein
MLLSQKDRDRVVALEQALESFRRLIADWPTINIVEADARIEELRVQLDAIPPWKSSA